MLLAVDIGNTNIHLGLWQQDSWALNWRARTVHDKTLDEYAVLVRNFLNTADVGYKAISGVVIASVVPILTTAFTQLVERYFQLEPVIVTSDIKLGVKIAIDQPAQAGADRIANAAALSSLYGGPGVVVDFGTSTNFDVVSKDNEYIGGAITPGINLAHDALVNRAAKLHKIDLKPPPNPIGRNTIHAMQSGIFWGYVSLIEGVTNRIVDALEGDKKTVIATGGLAPLFVQYTDVFDAVEPELTLNGLRIIYNLNRENGF